MKFLAYLFSSLSLLMSVVLFIRLKGINMALFAKLAASSLSQVWALFGVIGAALGIIYQVYWSVPIGVIGAVIMLWYVWINTRNHDGFERAFGADWQDRITPQQYSRMIKRRWNLFFRMKASPKPTVERDLVFWTIPENNREILCDLWHPAEGNTSGLAFIFFHGSGWVAGDKDLGTRPFFNHLVAQGHTVMDVAYRLCPEVDIYGMVGDIKRAIAWMKENASRIGVDPEKIILGGGSAGAHIALLAAYTPDHPDLTPPELKNLDLSVHGMVAYYAPVDLEAGYIPWMNANPNSDLSPVPIGTRLIGMEAMKYAGRMDILLGGSPEEAPHMYELASPITHVNSKTPSTLFLQGATDVLVPVEPTRLLHEKLLESGIPSVMVTFPLTEHMFDFLLPQVSPPAHSALYEVDRFLALLNNKDQF